MSRRILSWLAVVWIGLMATSSASAQLRIFMQIGDGTGAWAGNSNLSGRTGWTELTSCNFGFASPAPIGQPPLATTFSRVAVTKAVDPLSVQIFAQMVTGNEIPVANAGTNVTFEFTVNTTLILRLELKRVRINSMSTSGAASDNTLAEALEFSMGSVRLTPFVAGVAQTPKSWSILTNSATF